jgi:hypothetical protein
VQARNNIVAKHTLKNKHYKKMKSSQTLALIVAICSSSLRIVRNSILHRNCQQKALARDIENNPHMAKKFLAQSELRHRS